MKSMSTTINQESSRRLFRPDGSVNAKRIGLKTSFLDDFYFHLVRLSLPALCSLIFLCFTSLNVIFALLYLLGGDCIANARPGVFSDAFFFSVQTIAAVGYGAFHPITTYAHIVASLEALVGLTGFALLSAIMFARISRPTARVIFSRYAVIAQYQNIPTLMIRLANRRLNRILEASVQVTLLKPETSPEGITMRRFYNLELVRAQSPFFGLAWTVMHRITPESPLFGIKELVQNTDSELIVTVTGLDETLMQTVHVRHSYKLEEIAQNARFVDVMSLDADGTTIIDYTAFHDIVSE